MNRLVGRISKSRLLEQQPQTAVENGSSYYDASPHKLMFFFQDATAKESDYAHLFVELDLPCFSCVKTPQHTCSRRMHCCKTSDNADLFAEWDWPCLSCLWIQYHSLAVDTFTAANVLMQLSLQSGTGFA